MGRDSKKGDRKGRPYEYACNPAFVGATFTVAFVFARIIYRNKNSL
jgi:hypothetical protein